MKERPVGSETAPAVRDPEPDDVDAICRFGETHVRTHYAPLIGADAAGQQVRTWWNADRISAAVAEGLVVVAAADGEIVGVGQLGRNGDDPVVYKLYVHPGHRNHGLGPQLIDAIIQRL